MSTSGRSFRNTTERMVQILSYHLFLIVFVVVTFPVSCWAQYEDVRCKCICPNASVVGSQSGSNRKLYIKNVVPQRYTRRSFSGVFSNCFYYMIMYWRWKQVIIDILNINFKITFLVNTNRLAVSTRRYH